MKYDFYIDEKSTIWNRSHYTVEANSEEEAIVIMKEEFENQEFDEVIFNENEILYDTNEYITPQQNNGNSTKELYKDNNCFEDPILKNGI